MMEPYDIHASSANINLAYDFIDDCAVDDD